MEHERLDLSSLDAFSDARRTDAFVARVLARAEVELRGRAEIGSPVIAVSQWSVPTLAAAALLTLVSLAALFGIERPAHAQTSTVPEALVPAPASAWLSEDRAPSARDLISAVEGEIP